MDAEQKLELQAELSTKIRTYLNKASYDWKYKPVKGIKLVHYCDMIYVPKTLHVRVLKWYHCYLQHTGGDILAQTLNTIFRWLGIVDQARKLCRTCKDCQKFKKRNANYGLLTARDADTLTPLNKVCVDLIGTYTILAKVRQPDNKILTKELQLLCMTFIDPEMGWFEIVEVPIIDQSSVRISQIFNEAWLSIYHRPHKVIFDNGSEFRRNVIPFLKYFSVKPTCTNIKNPQANVILERIHQVVGSMLKTKDLANVTFDAVFPWGEILASIAYVVQ